VIGSLAFFSHNRLHAEALPITVLEWATGFSEILRQTKRKLHFLI